MGNRKSIWQVDIFGKVNDQKNSGLSLSYFACKIEHCVKSVLIRSYSGPYFPTFGLNTARYGVSLHIPSKCGKIRTRITPNTDSFQAVEGIKETALKIYSVKKITEIYLEHFSAGALAGCSKAFLLRLQKNLQ